MTCSMKVRLANMQEELDSMDAEQLRRARGLLRLTQAQLALEVGVKPGKHMDRTVRRWERGERKVPGSVAILIEQMLRDI